MATEYQTHVANTADQRTLGFFQLSVPTSLAVESMCGIHPDIVPRPNRPPVLNYKEVWINLRTLYRNIVNSMSKDIADRISSMEVAQILYEEMGIIPDMLQHYAGVPVKVVYYFSNMNQLEKKYPEAELRKDSTSKQQHFTKIMGEAIKILLAEFKDLFLLFDDLPPGNAVKTLILTHVVYDLLAEKRFGDLHLIESHTGRIKPRVLWSSKYYEGKKLAAIPFTEELLQVFGDHETFSPMDHRLRKAIVEIAEKRNWSAMTTRARIIDNLNDLQNPAHLLKIKRLFNVLI
jgi:hypothetical protein